MIRRPGRPNHTRRNLIAGVLVVVGLFGAFEAYSALQFYRNLAAGKSILARLERRVNLDQLNMSQEDAIATRNDFHEAGLHFDAAERYTDRDLVFNIAKL